MNKVLNRLNKYTEQNPEYEIWYRGQPNDYLLPDLRNYAQSMICPWRSELDTSLVPSLYRLLLKLLPNMKEYLRTCFELALISRFIESYFPDTQFSSSDNFILDNNLYEKFLLNQPPDERWDYHVFYQNLQRYFFLQHYGIPSPALDITQDPKVALFFAQNSLQEDQYVPVDFNTSKPILYIFLLDKELDLFINSKEMSEYHRLLRPLRQKCGLITGATFITRNDYSHLLALKIRIEKPIINRNFTAEYLLPSPNEDQFLYSLSDYCDKLNLTRIRPFVLQEN